MYLIKKHPYFSTLISAALALTLFLGLTNPANVGVGILVIPVVLLFLITYSAAQIIGSKLLKRNPHKRRITSLVIATFVTIIMILQSTGGISGADLILLGLIILISAVYIEKF